VFDEIPHSEKVLKRHQNSDDPCIMAWDHYMMISNKTQIYCSKVKQELYYLDSEQLRIKQDSEIDL
jgi:hypothetical protein